MHDELIAIFDRTHAAARTLREAGSLDDARALLDAAQIILDVAKRRSRRTNTTIKPTGEVEDRNILGHTVPE